MEKIEAHPVRFGRRQFIIGVGGLAGVLAASAVGVAGYEILKKSPKENPIPEREQNLAKALELLESYDNELIQDAVDFYRSDKNQPIITFLLSENNSVDPPARVIPSSDGTLKIALERDEFTGDGFDLKETAISLFEAFYVYQQAERDPKKFSKYPLYKANLEHDAEDIASQIFSEK